MQQESNKRPTPKNQFSFSRLKSFDHCPFKYRLRYLKGMKEAFRSIETYLGSTVHDVLEWMYGERRDSRSPDAAAVIAKYDEEWRSEWPENLAIVRTSDGPDTYYRFGIEMLNRFHEEVFCSDRSETIDLECRFSARLSDRIVFTGFADRIGRTSKGKLFVVDYKTSKRAGDDTEFSEGLQAPLYAACALDRHSEDSALAGYHYLRLGISRWHDVDRPKARKLLDRFRDLSETALEATEFPARPGILCAWCGFNHLCTSAEVRDGFEGGQRVAGEFFGVSQTSDSD